MKEIIVFKKHELYKLLDCLPMPMITDEDLEKQIKEGRKIVLFGKERKTEKIPESWKELKELCKEIEVDAEEDYIELFGVLVGSNILFCKDGAIFLNTDCCFKEKATPQQMWAIIKNLIGEKNGNKNEV